MGINLPAPPADYWSTIPWWAFVALVAFLSTLVSPLLIQWMRGRAGSYLSREQAMQAQQASIDSQRTELESSLRRDRDEARAEMARRVEALEAKLRVTDADRMDGWNAGRGMEDVAHDYRHQLRNAQQANLALIQLINELLAGRITPDRAKQMVDSAAPIEEPPRVPLLRDVPRKPPPPK